MSAFHDQIAVITGASSGIGKAIALALAAEGATLCLLGRNLETLRMVRESISGNPSKVFCYQVDLQSDEDIEQVVETLELAHKRIDLLIHSAGIISIGKMEVATIEDFDQQYRINVRAPYLLTQKTLALIKIGPGQIVFINSSVCTNPASATIGQYTATKQALKACADCLRAELNADGIRVLSIYPGRTASPMQAAIHQIEGKTYQPEKLMQPEDVTETVLHALSLPLTSEITDINIRPLKGSGKQA